MAAGVVWRAQSRIQVLSFAGARHSTATQSLEDLLRPAPLQEARRRQHPQRRNHIKDHRPVEAHLDQAAGDPHATNARDRRAGVGDLSARLSLALLEECNPDASDNRATYTLARQNRAGGTLQW